MEKSRENLDLSWLKENENDFRTYKGSETTQGGDEETCLLKQCTKGVFFFNKELKITKRAFKINNLGYNWLGQEKGDGDWGYANHSPSLPLNMAQNSENEG